METVEDKLCLWSADGTQFEIPLPMLGQFRIPFAPTADAELLILNTAPVVKSVSVSDEALHVTLRMGVACRRRYTGFHVCCMVR